MKYIEGLAPLQSATGPDRNTQTSTLTRSQETDKWIPNPLS
jgi:hypothetical protein